jgi:hypothetical protein
VLIDKDDLAAVLAGATNEQTTMGRKTLTTRTSPHCPRPTTSTTATTSRCRR